MIEGLTPYAEYKESGLLWVPRVPSHWGLIPNRAVLKKRKVLVGGNHKNFQLLSLTKGGVIVRDISTGKGKFSSDMGTSQEVRKGDFVFCLFDVPETPRTVGLSTHAGMITSAYTVFESRKIPPESVRYLERFYIAMDDRKLLSPLYSGLRNTIPPPRFLGIKTPQPTPDEQAAIVRFLDHANRKIDGFIRAKRKLIGLLNEQKQAIIHRAVTRGLDSDVALEPSGIPWLGDIPEHWKISPLKRTLSRMDYGTSESSTAAGKFPVLTMGHIQGGRVLLPESGGIDQIPIGLALENNDLLFNRTNSPELVGKVGIYEGGNEPQVTFASYLVRLRVKPAHNPQWLNYLLNSFRFWAFARSQALLSLHQANLNSSRYGRMNIPVPPRADQDSIVKTIKERTASINTAIARTNREIALMQEYRMRLTADIVTGKLDVREAAAKLPDLPVETTDEPFAAAEPLEEIETEEIA